MDIMLTRIVDMCKMRKVTQKDLTDALGLRSSAFSEWKSGKSKSYTKYVHHIACVLGTTAEYLQGTTDIIEPLDDSQFCDLSEDKKELLGLLQQLNEDDLKTMLKIAIAMAENNKEEK